MSFAVDWALKTNYLSIYTIAPVKKKSGAVRICTDLKKLNLAVKADRYVTFGNLFHKIKCAKVFSKLDATILANTFECEYGQDDDGFSSAPETFHGVYSPGSNQRWLRECITC